MLSELVVDAGRPALSPTHLLEKPRSDKPLMQFLASLA
jgi:hypothetical protein